MNTVKLTKRTWNWFKRLPKLKKFFVVLLAILLAYLVVVRPIQILLERRDFEMAYDYISDISGDIQKATGPASATETDKSCGYASAKFERGRLGCSVEVTLRYDGVSIEEALSITKMSIKDYREDQTLENLAGDDIDLHNASENVYKRSDTYYYSLKKLPLKSGFTCSLSYEYSETKNIYSIPLTKNVPNNTLVLSASCADYAKHPHYKVRE